MLNQIGIDRMQVIKGLSRVRKDWEAELDGTNLTEIEGNVGLLLADIAEAMELNQEEQEQALGKKLRRAVKKITGK